MTHAKLPRWAVASLTTLTLVVGATLATAPAQADQPAPGPAENRPQGRSCPPAAQAVGFSDSLDKLSVGGVTVGGLSSLAYDATSRAWASTVDNHLSDPSRIWFFRDLADPHIVGSPLVLRRPDGSAYDGTTADNEGLAVLPGGRFVVSSETEPSIRIFGRDGVQRSELPVPTRFAVTGTTPAGEATANATLESLTASPDGRQLVAGMEGSLAGDVSSTGDATLHRFLVYRHTGSRWQLQKQLAYRAEPGQRIPEIAAVGRHDLLVEEASFDPAAGNTVQIYAVHDDDRAPDVSAVVDLSAAPPALVMRKRLVADLGRCPTLGAPTKETQVNPLLDNYEGMAVTSPCAGRSRRREVGVSLISDDNFSPTQTTRILDLRVRVGRGPR